MSDQDMAFHEWTACEWQGHLFVNADGEPCDSDEAGNCRDCGEERAL